MCMGSADRPCQSWQGLASERWNAERMGRLWTQSLLRRYALTGELRTCRNPVRSDAVRRYFSREGGPVTHIALHRSAATTLELIYFPSCVDVARLRLAERITHGERLPTFRSLHALAPHSLARGRRGETSRSSRGRRDHCSRRAHRR